MMCSRNGKKPHLVGMFGARKKLVGVETRDGIGNQILNGLGDHVQDLNF